MTVESPGDPKYITQSTVLVHQIAKMKSRETRYLLTTSNYIVVCCSLVLRRTGTVLQYSKEAIIDEHRTNKSRSEEKA